MRAVTRLLAAPIRLSAMPSSPLSPSLLEEHPIAMWSERPRLLDGQPIAERLQWYAPPRREYSRRELLADRCINLVGAGLAWIGTIWLNYKSHAAGDPLAKQLCFTAFGVGLTSMLNCSAFFHYLCWNWTRVDWLLPLDHMGINAMIMGCYAPFMFLCEAYATLAFVWLLGISGVLLQAWSIYSATCGKNKEETISEKHLCIMKFLRILRYLMMGWAVLPVVSVLVERLPWDGCMCCLVGGLLYTAGVPFFVFSQLEFHTAIWHIFVLAGSVCFYLVNIVDLVGYTWQDRPDVLQ